jgi:4-amino-4-deoxy-L-arabinose transferase-like glycosyltransferase
MGRAGSWLATLGSGLALAGALLLKGPVSLVFFFGPPLAIAWNSRSPRSLASARTLVPLGLGLLLAGLWPLILFQSLNSEEVLGLWGGQLNKDEGHGLAGFAMERLEFVVGSLLAFAPASLILLPALGTPLWRRLRREPALAIAWQATLAGGICLLLFPGTNVRYFFPGLPFIALAAGRLLDAALEDAGSAGFPRRLEAWAKGLAWFSLAGCLVILVGFFTPIDGVSFNLVGLALGATLVFFALGVLRGKDSAARLCTAFLVLPLLIGQIVISQSAEAAARRHNNKRPAAEIQAALPRGESLTVGFRGAFNTFAYLRAPVHYTDDWRSLEKEAWLLLTDEQFATIGGAEDGVAWQYEQILRVRLRRGERVLLRIWP